MPSIQRILSRLRLSQKLSLLVLLLVILSVVVSVSVSGHWYLDRMMDHIEQNTLNVVRITAQSPVIIKGLENGTPDGSIQAFVEKTQQALEQIDIIVVADINGIRYGHTMNDRVGKMFSAEDHVEALQSGKTYVSTGPGTLGDSLRAFTPVINADQQIIGFVMAGTLLDSISRAKTTILLMMLVFVLVGLVIGIGGALFLSRYITRTLLYHEPEDIARLYQENKGILETVYEGVIAINVEGRITLINERAKDLLKITSDCLGLPINEFFPLSKLPEAVQEGKPLIDVTYALGDHLVLSNNVPIFDESGEITGGVSTFRDQTEVNRLAEEITGVKKIVDSLRATTHEFKNKLHVILGLAELGHTRQISEYIGGITENLQNHISFVLNHIKEPTIAALLIGKSQRAAELKIDWTIDEESSFDNKGGFDTNSLVIIFGNLIENALEHLETTEKEERRVSVLLNDEKDNCLFRIIDTGEGIMQPDMVFEKGFTTKEGSRGYGLALVKEQAERLGGYVLLDTEPGEGSMFEVLLPL